jgi:hypothetical protein
MCRDIGGLKWEAAVTTPPITGRLPRSGVVLPPAILLLQAVFPAATAREVMLCPGLDTTDQFDPTKASIRLRVCTNERASSEYLACPTITSSAMQNEIVIATINAIDACVHSHLTRVRAFLSRDSRALERDRQLSRNTAMARNERTSERVASIASKVLAGTRPTLKEARVLAASVLTQVKDKRKG